MAPAAFGVTPDFAAMIRGVTPETFVEYPPASPGAAWAMTPWQEVHARRGGGGAPGMEFRSHDPASKLQAYKPQILKLKALNRKS